MSVTILLYLLCSVFTGVTLVKILAACLSTWITFTADEKRRSLGYRHSNKERENLFANLK